MSEYLKQTFLPIAKTVGDLIEQLEDLPHGMEFGFLNQPRQQIAVREYPDGYECAVFNGLEDESVPAETVVRQGRSLPDVACGHWVSPAEAMPEKRGIVDIWLFNYNNTKEKRIPDVKYEGEGYFRKGSIWYDPDKIKYWTKVSKPSA